MNIRKFWAKGYRSLGDVTLDGLGAFNIFYGPNGVGKSNLIDAMQALFKVLPLAVDTTFPSSDHLSVREAGHRALEHIRAEDFALRKTMDEIVLGATFVRPKTLLEVEIRLSRPRPGEFDLQLVRLLLDGAQVTLPITDMTLAVRLNLVANDFQHLGVLRTLAPDADLVRRLFEAKNARDRGLRQRFDEVRAFLSQTLQRGLVDVFLDPDTKQLELRETLPEPNPQHLDIRLDRAGLGVVQLYSIIAPILLSGSDVIALEEPEAHLHAPSTGRQLREILHRLVSDGKVEQFFIATHSNLFDLDPTGYWDVSLDPATQQTRVRRAPLVEIDIHHLYEPGPAKHAIQQLLRYATQDEVIFRRLDGSAVSAGEMLQHLQEDDDTAVEFLRGLHSAALRVMRLDARKKEPVR